MEDVNLQDQFVISIHEKSRETEWPFLKFFLLYYLVYYVN